MQTEKVQVERYIRVSGGAKGSPSQFTSTSVSIPTPLLAKAREKANMSYRTFSQYISYLISQDLRRSRERPHYGTSEYDCAAPKDGESC